MAGNSRLLALAIAFGIFVAPLSAGEITGAYLEARTCQVYTGPCFANGETGATGKDAVMGWKIKEGQLAGVDLSGLSVVVAVRGSHTLGFAGLDDARELKSMVLLDSRATARQRDALLKFARQRAPKATEEVVSVRSVPIDLHLDFAKLTGRLTAGRLVRLDARQARPDDCICSNESAYYPPLVQLAGFVPGVAITGDVSARPLGSRWSIPDSRSAYLGRFSYE